MIRVLVAMVVATLLSGCATVVSGSSQEVFVNSDPEGARCVLSENGQQINVVDKTPATAKVEKTKYALDIRCEKDGAGTGVVSLHSDTDATTFGNIILGGVVGAIVDSASGANNKYDAHVVVALVPQTDAAVARKEPDAPMAEPVAAVASSETMPKPEPAAAVVAPSTTSETAVAAPANAQPVVLADHAADTAAKIEKPETPAAKRNAAAVPANLDAMDRSAQIVKLGYTYATPSDQTNGLSLLKVGMEVHVDGKVPGKDWYFVSGSALKKPGYAKAAALTLSAQ